MRKKFLFVILMIASVFSLAIGVSACDFGSSSAQEHTMQYIEYVAPTETTDGHEAYYYCTDCKKYYFDADGKNEITDLDDIVIPAIGSTAEIPDDTPGDTSGDVQHSHTLTHVARVEATCTASGNIEYWYCSDCGKYYSDEAATSEITQAQTILSAADHSWDSGVVTTEATCTQDGEITYTCSVCNETKTQSIPATDHTYDAWEITTNPTAEETGLATRTCSACNEEEQGHTQTIILPVLNEEDYTYTLITAATCKSDGSATYTYNLYEEIVVIVTIPASEEFHSFTEYTSNNDATCTADGTKTAHCDHGCGATDTIIDEGSAAGHVWNDGEITKTATCTEEGEITYTCTQCGETYVDAISKTAHMESEAVIENEVAATCTQNGSYDSVVYCSECGQELSRETITIPVAPTTGHTYGEDDICTSCGYEKDTSLGLEYTLSDDGTYYTVSGIGTCTDTDIVIPSSYSFKPVTCIAEKAFYQCSSLKNVKIPDSITSVGKSAFSGCTSLTSFTIPNSVTSLGNYVFYNCTSLANVTIGNGVTTIGTNAFENCSLLTSIIIPDSVESIGDFSFRGCSLENITLPSSVASIGKWAFYNCSLLMTITIPDSVESIGSYAFCNCSSLTSVCYNGTASEWANISFGDCYATPLYYASNFYLNGTLATDIILEGITDISAYAFYACTSLTSVTISDSVTSIGISAFYGCNSLESITIPFVGDGSSNTHFGYIFGARSYSTNSTYIPSSLTTVIITGCSSVGDYAFYNCSSLTSIIISDSVTDIGSTAFGGCSSLESITLPFVGGGVKTSSDTYQYPFGYIFGTGSYTDGTAVTQWYHGASTNSTTSSTYYIPSKLTSVVITGGSILYGAFYNCSSLTRITMPDNVESIGSYAFYNCNSLIGISIPDSVISIESYAFYNCELLTSVTIPDGVESIGSYSFYNCSSLEILTIGDGVEGIGSSAFYCCTSLTNVMVNDSVTSIGVSAFYGCDSLESITLPFVGDGSSNTHFGYIFGASVYPTNSTYVPLSLTTVVITGGSSIGGYAFYNCSSLTGIAIPDSVMSIGSYAFYNCSSLTDISIPDSVETIDSSAFRSCALLTSVAIGGSVTSIGDYAFYDCSSLTSITIPNSVETIGSSAFRSCALLTSVTIGDSVTSIGDYAFDGCTSLMSVTIPDSVTSIGEHAFNGCSSLTSITIPNGVANIKSYSFRNCSSLTSVTIGDSVTSIGDYAFDGCGLLTSITIPDSVTSIGSYTFRGCSSLTNITIPDSVTSIGRAFVDCTSLENITLPFVGDGSSNTHFGYVFGASTYGYNEDYVPSLLTTAVITGGTSIGSFAFNNCTMLKSITIPECVKSIYSYAFRNCSSLESITIGNEVETIEQYAFLYCTSLTSITMGNEIETIGSDAFRDCTSLTSVYYNGTASEWASISFSNVYATPLYYASDLYFHETLATEIILEGITSIGAYAFYNCISLENVTIGDSVTSIGNYAFYKCASLTEIDFNATAMDDLSSSNYVFYCAGQSGDGITVTIGANVTKIPAYLFCPYSSSGYAPQITYVIFEEDSVCESIGNYAFCNCSSLMNITIPDGVESIGYSSFSGCSSLIGVYYNGTASEWASISFGDFYANPLYHDGKLYLDGTLATEITIEGVTSVSAYAFYNCTSLTSVTIGDSVTSIGYSAFYECSSLESITIPFVGDGSSNTYFGYIFGASSYSYNGEYVPTSLTTVIITGGSSIGDYAFEDCSSLISITIPDSVTSIGSSAFYGCGSLTSITIPDSVTSIGSYAFRGCTSLTSITMGNEIENIGSDAFRDCTSLTSVYYNGTASQWANISFDDYYANPLYYAGKLYLNRTLVTEITIGGIASVNSYAFYNCTSLTNVTVSDDVTSIGVSAFYGCSSLESIVLPFVGDGSSNTHFGYVFGASSYLANSAYIPSSLITVVITGGSSIDDRAFYNCTSLTSITIPDSITSIGDDAFWYCSSLTSVTIPDSVETIGSAFYYCSSLMSVTIPDSVTYIGMAFIGCTSLENVTLPFVGDGSSNTHFGYIFGANTYESNSSRVPSSLTAVVITGGSSIDSYAFYCCGSLTSIAISDGVEIIRDYAFYNCKSLISFTIPDSVTSIGDYVFENCSSLMSITIGDGVESIGSFAFRSCTLLTSVTIGDSVTSIGEWAFYSCASLTSVTIGSSVEYIGHGAFNSCTTLTEINFNVTALDDLSSSNVVFYCAGQGGNGITVTIGANVTKIPANLFSNGSKVSYVVFEGDSVCESIGDWAFSSCPLTSITIPDSVVAIGNYAFDNCNLLISITIPDSVISIGDYAFCDCSSLTSVTIGTGVETIGSYAFGGCSSLTEVIIPDSVTSIGARAFVSCYLLTSVTIGESVKTIDSEAFYYCSALVEINFNATAMDDISSNSKIFYRVGESGDGIKVTIGANVTKIPAYLFNSIGSYATNLTSVVFQESSVCESIGSHAFYYCTSLTSITIPDSVTNIGDYAFYYCRSLMGVYYNGTASQWAIISFENSASNPLCYANLYLNGTLATEISLEGITYVSPHAFFNYTSLIEVTIGNNVTSIGSYAFGNCYKLVEVYNLSSLIITAGSTSYGYVGYYAKNVYTGSDGSSNLVKQEDYNFYNDNGTYYLMGYTGMCTEITFPSLTINDESVSYSIYQYAFYGCSLLTSITIPDSVTNIGDYAFSGCTALTNITITNSITSIGRSAFYNTAYYNDTSNWEDDVLYIGNYLIKADKNITGEYIITNGTILIADYAFYECSLLMNVTIPDSVTSIGSYAFGNCYKLVEVYNLSSLIITAGSTSYGYVGYYAKNVYTGSDGSSNLIEQSDYIFYNDNGVYYLMGYTGTDTEITLPSLTINGESVSYSIYQFAFYNCSSLTSVTIPDSVTSIGDYAFFGCTALTNITITDSITSIGRSAFYNTAYYNDASNWEDNVLYIGHYLIEANTSISGGYSIKEGTIVIAGSAFYNCSSLTSVTIGDSVTSIGSYAFYGCSSLTSITIPDSVTSIGNGVFYECSSLESVTIPDSVTSIGDLAFYYCTSLTSVYYGGTASQWSSITMSNIYSDPTYYGATLCYYSETEPDYTDGYKYWDYDDNNGIVI